ncbi:hypothetical protein PROFUN_07068 [Planoprotostelium fungivorum]|uniref:Uncharacterized protein n=1 Tax=Planoprotostelium fungivorum TaxID=1890364 RepID=A0A2P6NN21_9EUKA|nr:hypothetical protein PROFUN_07068 [Planoprotostelium fungivorum]
MPTGFTRGLLAGTVAYMGYRYLFRNQELPKEEQVEIIPTSKPISVISATVEKVSEAAGSLTSALPTKEDTLSQIEKHKLALYKQVAQHPLGKPVDLTKTVSSERGVFDEDNRVRRRFYPGTLFGLRYKLKDTHTTARLRCMVSSSRQLSFTSHYPAENSSWVFQMELSEVSQWDGLYSCLYQTLVYRFHLTIDKKKILLSSVKLNADLLIPQDCMAAFKTFLNWISLLLVTQLETKLVREAKYGNQLLSNAKAYKHGQSLTVRLGPAGIERQTKNYEELVTFHRDVRWPNVLYIKDLNMFRPPTWDNEALHRDTMHGYQPVHDLYQLALMVQQVESIWENEPKVAAFVMNWMQLKETTASSSPEEWKKLRINAVAGFLYIYTHGFYWTFYAFTHMIIGIITSSNTRQVQQVPDAYETEFDHKDQVTHHLVTSVNLVYSDVVLLYCSEQGLVQKEEKQHYQTIEKKQERQFLDFIGLSIRSKLTTYITTICAMSLLRDCVVSPKTFYHVSDNPYRQLSSQLLKLTAIYIAAFF